MRRRRLATACAAAVLALSGCGGGDDESSEKPAEPAGVTKSEGDTRLLRTAVDNYRRETAKLIAAVRSGLTQGDYDDDLNNDVYELRVAIYEFDQALRRIGFDPSAEPKANAILENNIAAISRLDPIIDARRWPKDTEDRVEAVLGDVEDTKEKVNALVAEL